eukprot:14969836-Alexandrium_andersonii.AAC.1
MLSQLKSLGGGEAASKLEQRVLKLEQQSPKRPSDLKLRGMATDYASACTAREEAANKRLEEARLK